MKTLIRHGRLVREDRLEAGDVLVEDGRILAVGPGLKATPDRVLDAQGAYVLPGLVDFHVHADDRIGECELADTYESASRVAVVNGITTLCSFVTQRDGESLIQATRRARTKARGKVHADLLWHLTPTRFEPGDWNDLQCLVSEGYRTLKLYTTYRSAGIYADSDRIDELFLRLGPLGTRFLVHCEDDARMATVDEGMVDLGHPLTHARLRPEAAEILAVENLVDLATMRRVPLHVVHVSTSAAAEVLLQARRTADITCETCPQYLWLDEAWLGQAEGHRWVCSPPLRKGRERFRELARGGAFDVVATDHCAFRREDKDTWDPSDVRTVPNGLAGLGALPHLTWKLWAEDPDRAALEVARRLSRNPADRAGFGHRKGALAEGFDADLVVLDPSGPEQPIRSTHADAFEPYPGFTSPLVFRHVLLRGEPVAQEGRLLHPESPSGRLLQPEP